jgi:cysteine sulfinate desulfinase/cysteine desulfurase-like protein
MKISPSAMESAIRFSFNPYLTKEDVDYTVDGLIKNYALLKRYTRR